MKNAIRKIQIWLEYIGLVSTYLSNLPINFPALPIDKIKQINAESEPGEFTTGEPGGTGGIRTE